MSTMILYDNEWKKIQINYPFNASPIEITGPMGVKTMQPSPYGKYDIEIICDRLIITPNEYLLKIDGKEMKCTVAVFLSDVAYGNSLRVKS